MNRAALILALIPLSACAAIPDASSLPPLPAEQQAFWDALESHCGKAYAGSLASEDARDAAFRGKAMRAHWADCSPSRIAIAFHVEEADEAAGWDRSRTWLVSRTGEGLRLKHDHRHRDGSIDPVTQYGGDTLGAGTTRAQDFPVDAYSIAMFEREGLDQVFRDAGFEWRGAGCSMCLAMNPDRLEGREVCASSSNRNFKGRQGSPTGRTLLMSPAMVVAAAIAGEVTDVREALAVQP